MKNQKNLLKMIVLSMLIALGVVISPILRVEGMCPMAHFINIVCSVFLGPWYSLLCATLIGIIRMVTMGIPPIALTGAIFGAFLSGVFYRLSKGKIIFAVLAALGITGWANSVYWYRKAGKKTSESIDAQLERNHFAAFILSFPLS